MFLNKELCANGISLRVETRIALLNEEHLIDETVKFSLALFLECGIGFLLGGLYSRGLSKIVYRSQNFYVQQYVDEGVEPYSRHYLNHTDHM